jgi:hypothetical protein
MAYAPDMDLQIMDQLTPPPRVDDVPFKLPNFSLLKQRQGVLWPLTSDRVSVSADLFKGLLRRVLETVQFDEHYYLYLYADVADAVAKGQFRSAHHHYLEFGYFEDRLPFRVEVDEAFYFWEYPDIEAEVAAGTLSSAQEHFERCGFREGRLPRENWSLLAGR